jgi:hypothetical protein
VENGALDVFFPSISVPVPILIPIAPYSLIMLSWTPCNLVSDTVEWT